MAEIKKKKKQRFKVQFYIDGNLETLYKSNKQMAKRLDLYIDFSEDFRKWFLRENLKVKEELERLSKERHENSTDGSTPTDKKKI